jgi:diguanylate cyclase (GGDEF)-like protein
VEAGAAAGGDEASWLKMGPPATETEPMDERRRSRLWPIWALTIVMTAGAVALASVVASYAVPPGTGLDVPWWLLALGFGAAEARALHLRFRGETHTCSVSEVVLVVGLFATAPIGLVAAQLIGTFPILLLVRRQTPMKLLFNVSQFVLSVEVAILIFHELASSGDPLDVRNWLAVLVAACIASIVQFVVVSSAITIAEGRLAIPELTQSFVWGLLCAVVNTMLGLVVVIVLSDSLVAGILLIGPLAVVFVAYRAYLSEQSKREGLQFLYRASELLSGERDLETGLVALLDFARESFHVEIAEIALLGDPDESNGYRTCCGPGDRSVQLEACELDAVTELVDFVAGAPGVIADRPQPGARLSHRHGIEISSLMLATIADESGVRGIALVARERGTGFDKFTKDETSLFETFVNHLGTTLEKTRLSTSLAQLRALKQELAHQAYHDSLTGLANRLMFRELVDAALEESARNANRVAVLFIDLDDFKTVNDTMGHAAGDTLLEEVASRIAASVGKLGTAARLGGDEFAVLLPDVHNDSEVRDVADRILVALGHPVTVKGQPVVAQASIGIASHVDAADAAELMQQADVAMYTAKRNGKGRFDEFEPNMSVNVARRHQLKLGLERAIADEEFTLQYQPVIDANAGTISGVEALLRWKDPTKGMMQPSEFVGVAEETGMIVPIGRIVLREAFRQAAAWTPYAPELRMFVNLSTRQLADPDIVEDVCSALEEAGLYPPQVVLEVTETAMMRDIDEAKATLRALKRLGVSIAADDFGTGFSSLSYLRELPIDVLKIAKPITDTMCESPQDAAFVKGIIELGHVVGMKVVAEGVETVQQYAHLVDMGCDFVQGYYYAPSMEPAEVSEIIEAARALPESQVALNAAG